MASNDIDPTTGYPIFLAGEAPDLGVDETTVAQYAADVGNRIVRANLAGLNAYPYARAGLAGHALDTKTDYVHTGTGWVRSFDDTGWITLPLQNGWVAFGGAFAVPRYRRLNGVVYVQAMIKSGTTATGTPITQLPVGFRPTSQILHPTATASTSATFSYVDVMTNGTIQCGTPTLSTWLTFNLSFPADQ